MRYGFVRTAALAPKIKVADTGYNAQEIIRLMKEAWERGARILVFPELCITGYTCGELFLQELLLRQAKEALLEILDAGRGMDGLFFVGLPLAVQGKLYNTAAVFSDGKLLGLVPKTCIPNYGEFYEARHFAKAPESCRFIDWEGRKVPFGTDVLFCCRDMPGLLTAAEICEDVWAADPPSVRHALHGRQSLSICRPATRSQGRKITGGSFCASSPDGWYAAMSMPAPGKGSRPRIWYSADII